jgi:hypothetical protein
VEWLLSGPFQNCVRWSRLPTKMAAKLKIDKKEDETLRNIPVWNYWAILNPTLWNDPWVVPFQICVRHFRPPTKMAATAERNLTKFWKGPLKNHSTIVWLQLAQWCLRRRLKCEMLTDGRWTKSDGNTSHGLIARWAKRPNAITKTQTVQ